MPPATPGPSALDRSIINPAEAARLKKRHIWKIIVIIWGLLVTLLLISIVGFGLVNGEWICLDRRPVWGPPENPDVYTSCSGHIDELLHR